MDRCTKTKVLGVEKTKLTLDQNDFHFQGLSFFNAVYNPAFNKSSEERLRWLRIFKDNGVNALRIWAQWDFNPEERTFIDINPDHTIYTNTGEVKDKWFKVLEEIIVGADSLDMVIELTLFSHEKQPNYPIEILEKAAREMAGRLVEYRNLILQIWNEDSTGVIRLFHAIKEIDPQRIVANSPGFAGILGDDEQNGLMDILTPHTARGDTDKFWEVAPRQVAHLLDKFQKPVIDDEPARCGTVRYGGIEGGTLPEQHILQIKRVRELGAYHTYHHDMFQSPYGSPSTPPTGIPDPSFSSFHAEVFTYLKEER